MLDERIAELIQADVDGELSVSEEDELRSVLDQSAEARQFREDMVRVAQLMAELPPVEVPAPLRRRVLERIELPARPRWRLDRLTGTRWFQPASYGLAIAAGVMMAVGYAQLQPAGPVDLQSLVGTMVSQGEVRQGSRDGSGRLEIGLPGLSGAVDLKPVSGGVWAVEFALDSDRPIELRLDLGTAGYRFGGFADATSGVEAIEVSAGEFRMTMAGSRQFVVFLRRDGESVSDAGAIGIAVGRQGEMLYQGSLMPASG